MVRLCSLYVGPNIISTFICPVCLLHKNHNIIQINHMNSPMSSLFFIILMTVIANKVAPSYHQYAIKNYTKSCWSVKFQVYVLSPLKFGEQWPKISRSYVTLCIYLAIILEWHIIWAVATAVTEPYLKTLTVLFHVSWPLSSPRCQGLPWTDGNIEYQQPFPVWHHCDLCKKTGVDITPSTQVLLFCM